jgi:hypothetical protein
MRMMQNFFMALDHIVTGRRNDDAELVIAEVKAAFTTFLGNDLEHFEAMTSDQIVEFFANDPYPTEKVEMVAMLLFEAGAVSSQPQVLGHRLTMADTLITYLAGARKSASLDHMAKQQYIRKRLGELE